MHIENANVKPARDIDEATAREELAQEYDDRAERYARAGRFDFARIFRTRAAEIRKGKP